MQDLKTEVQLVRNIAEENMKNRIGNNTLLSKMLSRSSSFTEDSLTPPVDESKLEFVMEKLNAAKKIVKDIKVMDEAAKKWGDNWLGHNKAVIQ